MIRQHEYRCDSEHPAEASMVCVEQGCQGYALTCGRSKCDCGRVHSDHDMKMLDGVIKKITKMPALSEDLLKLQKSIEILIDSQIEKLKQLKVEHKRHVQGYLEKQFTGGALRRSLIQMDKLEMKEATGHCFYKLLKEMNNLSKISNPYISSIEQVYKKCEDIQKQADAAVSSIQSLWKKTPEKVAVSVAVPATTPTAGMSNPRFSSTLKHTTVEVTENGKRANRSGDLSKSVVLVEPSLPMNTTSRITFRINKNRFLYVGVCYRNMVSQQSYYVSNIDKNAKQGIYLLDGAGYIYSHSVPEDNNQKKWANSYKEGDEITLELDPSTGKLTYFKAGMTLVQNTSIRSTTTQPVHFCAASSYQADDISIV